MYRAHPPAAGVLKLRAGAVREGGQPAERRYSAFSTAAFVSC